MEDKNKFIDLIKSTAQDLGLYLHREPEEFFDTRTKTLFTSLADSSDGKVVFRFAFGTLLESLKKEFELYTSANKIGIEMVPSLINFKDGEEYNWLIYKYCEGSPSGNVYQFASSQNYAKLLSIIEDVDNLEKMKLNVDLFRKRQPESWHRLIKTIVAKKPELLRDDAISKAVERLSSAECPSSDHFVHGDMHPGNIILGKSGIQVIDWESAHFDCYGFDLSFLYIRSYDRDFRGQLLDHIGKQGEEKLKAFCYVLTVNLLRDYFEWHLIAEEENELLKSEEILNNAKPQQMIADLKAEIDCYYKLLPA